MQYYKLCLFVFGLKLRRSEVITVYGVKSAITSLTVELQFKKEKKGMYCTILVLTCESYSKRFITFSPDIIIINCSDITNVLFLNTVSLLFSTFFFVLQFLQRHRSKRFLTVCETYQAQPLSPRHHLRMFYQSDDSRIKQNMDLYVV